MGTDLTGFRYTICANLLKQRVLDEMKADGNKDTLGSGWTRSKSVKRLIERVKNALVKSGKRAHKNIKGDTVKDACVSWYKFVTSIMSEYKSSKKEDGTVRKSPWTRFISTWVWESPRICSTWSQ